MAGDALILEFPIEIDGQPDGTFAGYLYPARRERRGVLQVLVHGNSYDHRYWDAGVVNGQDYSYAHYMTTRGYDLLALDLPGVGRSGKPDGFAVTVQAVSRALSNLIGSMRKPEAAAGYEFTHIALVGHSLGAMVAVHAEAHWPAADSLIVTGTGYFAGRATSGWAPGVREALLKDEYAVIPPEGRLKFYHRPQADPDLITYDNEVLRTSMPSRLWADTIALRDDPNPDAAYVTCPVYVQLGDNDSIMLGEYATQERQCYSSSTDVTVDRLPDTGHCFNLHLNRHRSWQGICGFLDRITATQQRPPGHGTHVRSKRER